MKNKMMRRTAIVAMAAIMAVTPSAGVFASEMSAEEMSIFQNEMRPAAGSLTDLFVKLESELKNMDKEEVTDFFTGMQKKIQTLPVEEQVMIVKGIPELEKVVYRNESDAQFGEHLSVYLNAANERAEFFGTDKIAAGDFAWISFGKTMMELSDMTEEEVIKDVDLKLMHLENMDLPEEVNDVLVTTYKDIISQYDSYLNPVSVIPASYQAYCTADTLNIRQEASAESTVLGTLAKDKEVQVTGTVVKGNANTGWLQITVGGVNGYVAAEYMTTTAPKKAEKAPEVEKKFTVYREKDGKEITLSKYTDGSYKDQKGNEFKKTGKGEWLSNKGNVYLNKKAWEEKQVNEIKDPVVAPVYNEEYRLNVFGGSDVTKPFKLTKLPDGTVIDDKYVEYKEVKDNKGIWENVKTKEKYAEKKGDERLIKILEDEAMEKAEQEAEEQEAKEIAEREAKEAAEQAAREAAEKEAKEQAEREAKEAAEQAAKEAAEQEAKEKAEQEAKEAAEKEAKERAEQEAKEAAEQAAKEAAEQEAEE